MHKYSKIISVFIVGIASMGCRNIKPTVSFDKVSDNVALSLDSSSSLRLDSIMMSKENKDFVDDGIEFVEEGGLVSLTPDGGVVMSGVAKVRSTRHQTSADVEAKKSLSSHSQLKDSVASVSQSVFLSESKVNESVSKGGRKLQVGIILFILLIIILMVLRIWRNLKK